MKFFAAWCLCCSSLFTFAQQSKKTFVVFSGSEKPLAYNQIGSIEPRQGKKLDILYNPATTYAVRKNGYAAYQESGPSERAFVDSMQQPMANAVASMAYDSKSNRLFFVPQQLSELRYMDLNQPGISFTYLQNQSLNLLHDKNDAANQLSRMTIGADGFGYALSNDGEHLVKFQTQGNPIIQDLGVLVDNPKNKILVRSSCTSWGGDLVSDVSGALYLITGYNHVFKISLPGKSCDYIGTIQHLPEGFTSNGAAVDENGDLLVGSATNSVAGSNSVYRIKWGTLEAEPANDAVSGLGNISDMASSNLLFQKNTQSNASPVQFLQPSADQLSQISVYPNPVTQGKLTIKTNNITEEGVYKIVVLDVSGKAIMEGKMNMGLKTNTQTFNFPARKARGVYFVQVADAFNRTLYSQQLIVE